MHNSNQTKGLPGGSRSCHLRRTHATPRHHDTMTPRNITRHAFTDSQQHIAHCAIGNLRSFHTLQLLQPPSCSSAVCLSSPHHLDSASTVRTSDAYNATTSGNPAHPSKICHSFRTAARLKPQDCMDEEELHTQCCACKVSRGVLNEVTVYLRSEAAVIEMVVR